MAAMRKLLDQEMIFRLVQNPEKLDMNELLELSRGFFTLQAVVGSFTFIYGAFYRSMGLSTIGNLAIPLLGIYSARDDSPENYKSLRVCALYWVLGAVYYFFEAFLGLCLRSLLSGSLKAVVYGLQWLVLARLWRWMQVRYVGTVKFYLNIVIKNKQEAVQAKSMEKSRIAGKLLGKIANRLVSDDMFSEKVAANIERNIPQRLQNEGGITASAATQFHRGNFIVVLVSIEQIDLRKMLQSKLDEKKMKRFDQIMHYLEFFPSWVKVDLQNLILQEVGNSLLNGMPESMTKQLRDMGGLDVEVESKRLSEEAEFFFAVMKQMDEVAAKPRKESSTPSLASPSSPSKTVSSPRQS